MQKVGSLESLGFFFVSFFRIFNMQEKLFISRTVFLFFRPKESNILIQKQMTAIGLGQQGSQAVC